MVRLGFDKMPFVLCFFQRRDFVFMRRHTAIMLPRNVGISHQGFELFLHHWNAFLDRQVLNCIVVHPKPIGQPLIPIDMVHPPAIAFDQTIIRRSHKNWLNLTGFKTANCVQISTKRGNLYEKFAMIEKRIWWCCDLYTAKAAHRQRV